ncbi:BTB/POZ domain-containing protein 18 isoform X2 [Hemicordylus capensis]|uniref:BTB/POZ domain-containing protein 18 isoform X2 n=1 Tax=Hemicordylus capensis TaxID=884348 RepID=UPI0023049731|nr:BTB/POZ domain-containing protein 18 isoform X2 [Hemicordylus capensis]
MGPPAVNPKILYRNSRLLRMVFLQLHRQQRADLFCDVVLQAEGQAVPAHCCILSACSPFFTERLEREMPPKGHKVVLELRGLKIGTLRKLVDFLYTSEMEVSREEAQDVLAAARQLQVSELESLQLEGGKLVKKAWGRRLNRDCLQLSSPISIPEARLIQSPPACSGSSLTSWLITGKHNPVVKLPCTKAMSRNSDAEQRETKKQKPAAASLSGGKEQVAEDSAATPEPLRAKARKHPAGTVRNVVGSDVKGSLHTLQPRPGEKQTLASSQESKKIKLSRPKLSSQALPISSATEDCDAVATNKASRSIRRLWRQKSPLGKNEAEGGVSLLGIWSPPPLPKATKGRKRNSSEPSPCSSSPGEARQIGRVKLRKVINGSCWEVVQEPPAAQPIKAANSVPVLADDGSPPQLGSLEQEIVDLQQPPSSSQLLPAKLETAPLSEKALASQAESKVALEEENSAVDDPYELNVFMLEQLADEKYDNNLASAGELEHMLDLLLADDETATGEPQGTAAPEGMPMSYPAPGEKKMPLGNAGAEERDGSADTLLCPQSIEAGSRPPQGEQEAALAKISKGSPGSADRGPFLALVCRDPPLVTSQPSGDCLAFCKPASAQLDSWTTQPQWPVVEKEAARLAGLLPATVMGGEDQGFPSCRVGASGAETKPCSQALLRSPLQHSLDCKLLPLLASLEEEEIDVGGAEELFIDQAEGIQVQ